MSASGPENFTDDDMESAISSTSGIPSSKPSPISPDQFDVQHKAEMIYATPGPRGVNDSSMPRIIGGHHEPNRGSYAPHTGYGEPQVPPTGQLYGSQDPVMQTYVPNTEAPSGPPYGSPSIPPGGSFGPSQSLAYGLPQPSPHGPPQGPPPSFGPTYGPPPQSGLKGAPVINKTFAPVPSKSPPASASKRRDYIEPEHRKEVEGLEQQLTPESNFHELKNNNEISPRKIRDDIPDADLIDYEDEGEGESLGDETEVFDESLVRVFIALFDYDPATMSPNPDAIDEELPFKEGQLIKVHNV